MSKRELVDFKREQYHEAWDIRAVGKADAEDGAVADKAGKGRRRPANRFASRDVAECFINEEDNLVFEGGCRQRWQLVVCCGGSLPAAAAALCTQMGLCRSALAHRAFPAGAVYSRGGLAEVGAQLQLPSSESLHGSEGLVVRVRADEHPYTFVVRTSGGSLYSAKFTTRPGYSTVRLPFNTFRPAAQEDPPLQPGTLLCGHAVLCPACAAGQGTQGIECLAARHFL